MNVQGDRVMAKEIIYRGWTICHWFDGGYGLWYPNGKNTGQQFTSLARAKAYIRYIETG